MSTRNGFLAKLGWPIRSLKRYLSFRRRAKRLSKKDAYIYD
ncbi:hypothetical protein A6P39_016115 [Streptomyces sp. FXJ1.172]|nr:hypothetical protein [Streptomyces sp. FXJ1.172]WEO95426.1 hypothetical protein A6P39_016115 [Streptomyces sp. FXJ1.172]